MFSILKSIIWIALILVAAYFVMDHFGYQANWNYFKESRQACEQRVKDCSEKLIHNGIDNAKCDLVCVDKNIIIKKK